MFDGQLADCPACERPLEAGFSHRNVPLSFLTPASVRKFFHVDQDLHRAGMKTMVPWIASYSPAFRCAACRILIVDYGRPLSSKEAKKAAAAVAGSA